mmetsp:Transcript_25952/g.82228  ORF Transcript_25952/g.82228 Transcript_25952/m.82228 type:complete len:281 (+) Transcript_25952:87-929(+)
MSARSVTASSCGLIQRGGTSCPRRRCGRGSCSAVACGVTNPKRWRERRRCCGRWWGQCSGMTPTCCWRGMCDARPSATPSSALPCSASPRRWCGSWAGCPSPRVPKSSVARRGGTIGERPSRRASTCAAEWCSTAGGARALSSSSPRSHWTRSLHTCWERGCLPTRTRRSRLGGTGRHPVGRGRRQAYRRGEGDRPASRPPPTYRRGPRRRPRRGIGNHRRPSVRKWESTHRRGGKQGCRGGGRRPRLLRATPRLWRLPPPPPKAICARRSPRTPTQIPT